MYVKIRVVVTLVREVHCYIWGVGVPASLISVICPQYEYSVGLHLFREKNRVPHLPCQLMHTSFLPPSVLIW